MDKPVIKKPNLARTSFYRDVDNIELWRVYGKDLSALTRGLPYVQWCTTLKCWNLPNKEEINGKLHV